jgi:hypothetical protein
MKSIRPLALALLWLAEPGAAAELPSQLKTCVSMLRDAERLACYDNAVALILSGSTDASAPSAENMFGANPEIAPAPSGGEATRREELRQITGSVSSLYRADGGMLVLTLDNGQVWRQQDGETALTVDSGDQVTIVRASLGTFRITDKRGRSARFKRVR